jgi:hypothetical protein
MISLDRRNLRNLAGALALTLTLFSPPSRAKTEDALVSIRGNVVEVRSEIYIYGADATQADADRIEKLILDAWDRRPDGKRWTYFDKYSGKTFEVEFDVRVELYQGVAGNVPKNIPDSWNPLSRKNYIKITHDDDFRSFVRAGDEGTWRVEASAHEFGHLIGLNDRYHDVGQGESLYSEPNEGWEGNIMASSRSNVEQRNIDAFLQPVFIDYRGNRLINQASRWLGLGEVEFNSAIDNPFNRR